MRSDPTFLGVNPFGDRFAFPSPVEHACQHPPVALAHENRAAAGRVAAPADHRCHRPGLDASRLLLCRKTHRPGVAASQWSVKPDQRNVRCGELPRHRVLVRVLVKLREAVLGRPDGAYLSADRELFLPRQCNETLPISIPSSGGPRHFPAIPTTNGKSNAVAALPPCMVRGSIYGANSAPSGLNARAASASSPVFRMMRYLLPCSMATARLDG